MHCQPVIPAYADNDIGIDQRAAVTFGQNKNLIVVMYVQCERVVRRHVDVTFGNNHPFWDCDLAPGSAENTAGSVFRVSGLADDTGDSQFPGIRKRQFDLCFFTEGTENRHVFESASGADDIQPFPAQILSGLAEFLDIMELSVFSI